MVNPKTTIVISAVDQTKAAADSATKGFQTLSSTISKIPGFGGIAASLTALASLGAFKSLIADTISWAAGMEHLSEITGASVENLSALTKVAKISGTEFDSVEHGMIRLAKALAGADDEAKGAGHALAAIGLEAKNLQGLDTADAMKQVADALNQYADGAGKTALAQDLLGKSGAKLLPFLKDLAEEEKLQSKLTKEQAESAKELEKAWNRTNVEGGAWAKSLALDLIPTLASLMDFLTLTKMGIYQFGSSLAVVANDIKTFATVAAVAVGAGFTSEGQDKISSLLDQRKNFNEAANEETAGRLSKYASLRDKIDKAMAGGAAAKPRLAYTSRDPKEPAAGRGRAAAKERAPGSVQDYDAILMERVARAIEGTDIVKAEELTRMLEKLDILAAAGLDPALINAVRDDLTGATKAAADEVKRLNDLLEKTPTVQIEKARDDMVFLTKALEAGKIKEEQYLEAVTARLDLGGNLKDTLSDMDQFAVQAAKNMQDAFAEFLFDPFAHGTQSMLEGFGIAVRRMIANAVAADLGKRLFGDVGAGKGVGGLVGAGLDWLTKSFKGSGSSASAATASEAWIDAGGLSFAVGTDYVPRDMIAQIHKGERIIPAAENRMGGGGGDVTIVQHFNGSQPAPEMRRAAGQGAREAWTVLQGARRYV